MKFQRRIGTFGILCASLGGIVGSGWLFGSLFAAQMAGPASLISWIIGGFSIMFLALTFAELSSMFPISGGVAAFPIFTHGKLAGFILTWVTWVTYVVSIAQEVQSTVLYLGNRYPSWIKKEDGINVFTETGFLVAFGITFVLILINSFGSKILSNTNALVTVWKLIVPFAVVVIFLFTAHNYQNLSLPHAGGFAPYGIEGILSAVALAGVVYSFCGFQHGAILAGEAKNPQKSIPIALIGSLLICMLLYIGLQYAFITALPESAIAQGWNHLSFTGDAGPLAGIAVILGLGWLAGFLYVDAIVSPLGTGVLYISSSARIVQNMGISGNAPKFFAKITKAGTPLRAVILSVAVSLLAFLPFKGWQEIVSFLSSALVFSFAVGPICLFALRKQQPKRNRPFRLPMGNFISFIAFYVCNMMIFWSGWTVIWKLGVTLVAGAIVFIISNYLHKNTENKITKSDYIAALWFIPYMGIFCILSYFSSFQGGTRDIPLGIDFGIMFVFSLAIFYLSRTLCLSHEESSQNTEQILRTQY